MNLDIFKKEKEPEVQMTQPFMYTEDQLMARLRFFIGICLALTLTGIVFVVLYSIIFVTQPLNAISPIDQKFFELIIPIATFLTGTLSGIMLAGKDDKETKLKALEAATRGGGPSSPSPTTPRPMSPVGSPVIGMATAAPVTPRPVGTMAPVAPVGASEPVLTARMPPEEGAGVEIAPVVRKPATPDLGSLG